MPEIESDQKLEKQILPDTEASSDLLRCKDCDSDCWKVMNHLSCWIGGTRTTATGDVFFTEIAEGYCPWLHPEVPYPPKE